MARSLRTSKTGLEKAEQAFRTKGWTQDHLAGRAECTRQTVSKFFAQQSVEMRLFKTICIQLSLEWGEIAQLEDGEEKPTHTTTIDALVNQVREKVSASIQKQCGWMRVLDMTHPIGLNDIYTDVNILEKITALQQWDISQLLENCNPENFERFGLNLVVEKRVSGLVTVEQHSKLMILGKPGAGKTTFLKRIAIQCNSEQFLADHVPIFITLKDFAEKPQQPGFLQYIHDQFGLNDTSDQEIINTLLHQGRAIVLLDGLDEVRQADNDRVLREIRNFSTHYDTNHFVITCRIASNEYTFEQFTEVEVADFNDKQIAEFARNWFQTKDPKKAEQFIQKLQENHRIKELATNPLLLTLLCLLFDESTDFPSNRSELYQEGVDVLLKKWDGKRSIERDQVYHKLSLKRKQDLLSKIALETFEVGNYFFKERLVEEYISNYIQNLPDAQADQEALLLDSKAVLKSIEAQHGLLVERARKIYSFSHLTFHEFFTARNIDSQHTFQQLVSHITDKHWREVFLLTVGMLKNADDLLQLMKQQIDQLVATDDKLQQFLTWINQKSCLKTRYKPVAIRAFYLSLYLDLSRTLYLDLSLYLSYDLYLSLTLYFCLSRSLDSSRSLDLSRSLDPKLKRSRQQIKDPLPHLRTDAKEVSKYWWQENSQAWVERVIVQKLRKWMIKHRNIGHDWQFSDEQRKLLQQYYDANKLLADCLNSECYVSREVRQHIEDTLLLPVKTSPGKKNFSQT